MKIKTNIKLEQAGAGQILASDVIDSQGHCLVSANTLISEETLKKLRQRGVEMLTIWQQQTLTETEIAQNKAAIESALAHRFRHIKDNPDMCRLHDMLLSWRLQSFMDAEKNEEEQG